MISGKLSVRSEVTHGVKDVSRLRSTRAAEDRGGGGGEVGFSGRINTAGG